MERYFAQIINNVVERVIVAPSKEWCEQNLGGAWIETFQDGTKNYASQGHTYRPDKNNFVAPKPYPSFVLDEKLQWQPPVKKPDDLTGLAWSEKDQSFKAIDEIIIEKNG